MIRPAPCLPLAPALPTCSEPHPITIDDHSEVGALLAAIEAAIPFSMLLGPGLRLTLRRQGLDIPAETAVVVERVFYMGDEAGIMCGLPALSGQNAVVVSRTPLVPVPGDPQVASIIEYQRRRVTGIAKQNARGAGGSERRNVRRQRR